MDTNEKKPTWTELVDGTMRNFFRERASERVESLTNSIKLIEELRQRGILKRHASADDLISVDDLPEPIYIAKE